MKTSAALVGTSVALVGSRFGARNHAGDHKSGHGVDGDQENRRESSEHFQMPGELRLMVELELCSTEDYLSLWRTFISCW